MHTHCICLYSDVSNLNKLTEHGKEFLDQTLFSIQICYAHWKRVQEKLEFDVTGSLINWLASKFKIKSYNDFLTS